mgnify:CR=1 FL=1
MTKEKEIKELKEEIELLDDMLPALVELLEEKVVLKYEEWEKRMKEKIKEGEKLNLRLNQIGKLLYISICNMCIGLDCS